MTEQDILENLESQLIGFKVKAATYNHTEIAIMIARFIAHTRQKQNNLKELAE
jgi:hypothetical protein